ncbi:hypothetical protein DPMN_191324 [Dreissena polymorpha]|uniref:Uncharacterized protein n=1 Tax=Dreissena polymorpha TaxID=45954 RepID=A0A9D4B632_DREPO|nr:hypothetical protein DPMN_191324 [Dreissena polymorpha]
MPPLGAQPCPDPPSALPPSPCSLLSKTMHGVGNGASGSCPVVDQDNWTLTDINRIRTGGVTHEFRTNRKLTHEDRTSNGVENFEHAQNFPTDGTDINGYRRTRSGFTGYETDIKRIRMHKNG